jgi:hypothetical protein
MKLVDALNAIHLNVWAICIMSGGIVLMCCKHAAEGGTLITGGFALLRNVDTKKEAQ